MTDRRQKQAQRRHEEEMAELLEDAQIEMMMIRRTRDLVPAGWQGLERSAPCRPTKTKMCIRLDADMLAWYRNLGNGYQNRMNAVLRAYMNAIISKHIECKDEKEWLNLPV